MAKVSLRSIIDGGCSSSSCFHNHTGVCAVDDVEHMQKTLEVQVVFLKRDRPPVEAKWECDRYVNERGMK